MASKHGAGATVSERKIVRCAIYARKSTEEGLSQPFNSLDAQRESAEAYIALGHAMFPGRSFSTPFFVDYGKDEKKVNRHGADRYLFATSNDGAWNNGNWMTLGRVPRDRIARLDPGDWEFVHGFDDKRDPIWKPGYASALYTFWAPGRTSMCGIHYIPPLNRYILPQWHYTRLDDPIRGFDATRWEFYEAPAPWGPWTLFYSQDFEPQGWYNPCIPAKFISPDGRKLWLFTAGNFIRKDLGLYGLWMIPMTLEG